MNICGVDVSEQRETYGYSWHWDDARGFQSEIQWRDGLRHLDLGTRMLPGGWTHNRLTAWGEPGTIEEARATVERYVERIARA